MCEHILNFNPIALRKAKIVYNFGLSECNRVAQKRAGIGYNFGQSYCDRVKQKRAGIGYNFDLSECNRVKQKKEQEVCTVLAFLSAIRSSKKRAAIGYIWADKRKLISLC